MSELKLDHFRIDYIVRAKRDETFSRECSNLSLKRYLLKRAKNSREMAAKVRA